MSMKDWVEKEIKLACEKERGNGDSNEWDYGVACYESAYKAFKSLCDDGHSGMSISITKNILNRLIDGKCLTPIEDTEDVWNHVSYDRIERTATYQCKRMSSLLKYVGVDGTVKYNDVNRVIMVDDSMDGTTWHSGLCDEIVDKMFPITMPYIPENTPFKVHVRTYTTQSDGTEIITAGTYNTLYVDYIIKPDGEELNIFDKYMEDEETGEMILVTVGAENSHVDVDKKSRLEMFINDCNEYFNTHPAQNNCDDSGYMALVREGRFLAKYILDSLR